MAFAIKTHSTLVAIARTRNNFLCCVFFMIRKVGVTGERKRGNTHETSDRIRRTFKGVCVAELSENSRWVRVTLTTTPQKDGSYLHMFCIENPCTSVNLSEITGGRTYTSKKGKHQGVGLRCVSQTVKDTGGNLIINVQNSVFTAKVVYEVTSDFIPIVNIHTA